MLIRDMVHGWMTRGADDAMIPQPAGIESVHDSQASALKLAAEFIQKVVQESSWVTGNKHCSLFKGPSLLSAERIISVSAECRMDHFEKLRRQRKNYLTFLALLT